VGRPPGILRIAVSIDAMLGASIHPENVAAVEATAALLEGLGHNVTVARPIVDVEELGWAGTVMLAADVAAGIERACAAAGRAPEQSLFEQVNWLFGIAGNKVSGKELAAALHVARQAPRKIAPFFDDHDVLVESTIGRPPWRTGELAPTRAEARVMDLVTRIPTRAVIRRALAIVSKQAFDNIPNTPLWNITGQPSMSVPLHMSEAGLPIGIQFTARYGDEATLFRLASQLEAARPWRDRKPALGG
jgi:amidase